MQSDAELVNGCLDGERAAFAVLVKRYGRLVRAVALNVLGDYHCAADVSQDAFVTAYKNLGGLRKPQSFGPWLMKITHRCALDYLRRTPKQARLENVAAPAIDSKIENPDGRLDENRQRLLAALVKLPAGEKQVIMLRYFAGQSVKDVADVTSRTVGTVTKQLSRARKRLRKLLKEA